MGNYNEEERRKQKENEERFFQQNQGIKEDASTYANTIIAIALIMLAGFLLYLVFK